MKMFSVSGDWLNWGAWSRCSRSMMKDSTAGVQLRTRYKIIIYYGDISEILIDHEFSSELFIFKHFDPSCVLF